MTEIDGTTGRPADTKVAHIMYLMHGLSPFTFWLLAVVAVVVGVMNRDSVRSTFVETHYSWLARTFWWGLLWIVIAGIVTFILVITVIGIVIAWIPYTLLFLWYMYRVIRGWLLLNDGKRAPG